MKRSLLTCIAVVPLFLAACAGKSPSVAAPEPVAAAPVIKRAAPENVLRVTDAAGTVSVEKVPFRAGVSSTSVEKLAGESGCVGKQGAGLMTEKGPVEIYRMQCDDGRVFMARCELRQCRPMR